jgi:hypothetical protein
MGVGALELIKLCTPSSKERTNALKTEGVQVVQTGWILVTFISEGTYEAELCPQM